MKMKMEILKNRKLFNKRCRVCGDKAIGFNFNGLSCESCKAFFRRQAILRQTNLTCSLTGGKCEMSRKSRKYCKRCRLDKCLAIGMKMDMVFCRIKNKLEPESREICDKSFLVIDMNPKKLIPNSFTLKQHELTLLSEVQNAIGAFQEMNGSLTNFHAIEEANSVPEFCQLIALDIRKMIKFCKSIQGFRDLTERDQLTLLKGSYPEMSLLQAAFNYQQEEDGIVVKNSQYQKDKIIFIKLDVLQKWKLNDIYSILQPFICSLHLEMDDDATVRNFIFTQLLFKPRPGLNHLEAINYHHKVHHYLLRRYLEQKYFNIKKANRKYFAILHLLNQIDQIAETLREVYVEIQTQSPYLLDPVLSEIYS